MLEADISTDLSWVLADTGGIDDAIQLIHVARRHYAISDTPEAIAGRVRTLRYEGVFHLMRQDWSQARHQFEHVITEVAALVADVSLSDETVRKSLMRQAVTARDSLGIALTELGDFERAEAELTRSHAETDPANSTAQTFSILNLAKLRIRQRRFDEAQTLLEVCWQASLDQNNRYLCAAALHHLAEIALLRGNHDRARALAIDAAAIYQRMGALRSERQLLNFLKGLPAA